MCVDPDAWRGPRVVSPLLQNFHIAEVDFDRLFCQFVLHSLFFDLLQLYTGFWFYMWVS